MYIKIAVFVYLCGHNHNEFITLRWAPASHRLETLILNMEKCTAALMGAIISLCASAQTSTGYDPSADPKALTADYYLQLPFEPDTAWRFSNERYRDMGFYRPGKARVEINVSGIPEERREEYAMLQAPFPEEIMRRENNLSAALNEKDQYVLDFDLPGPAFIYFVNIDNILVQPGDTLEVFGTASGSEPGSVEALTMRSRGESAMINALLPVLHSRMGIPEDSELFRLRRKALNEGPEGVMRQAAAWGELIDSLAVGSHARRVLNATPLSTYGKDMVMMSALARVGWRVDDMVKAYFYKKMRHVEQPDGSLVVKTDSTWVPIDTGEAYAAMLRHRDLIYDNPLALCNSTTWAFTNYAVHGPIFMNYELRKVDEYHSVYVRTDPFGMKGTFMFDLAVAQDIASSIRRATSSAEMKQEEPRTLLDDLTAELSDNIVDISHPRVAAEVLGEYRKLVSRLEGGRDDISAGWTPEQKALWQKLTAPYAGNIILMDFWGMGCGPCRTGMIGMRETVEALKDEPIRFLYVCNEEESPRERAEKWMNEKNIRGEHIYVSAQEWVMLTSMLNFSAIPHGLVADRSGNIIRNGEDLSFLTVSDLRDLLGRF